MIVSDGLYYGISYLANPDFCALRHLGIVDRQKMNDTEKLAVLADTISKHACEVVGRQWADIYRPALDEIFSQDHESMIRIGEREVPIKVVIESLRADFVERKAKFAL
jgi:hypothetical protein